MVYGSDQVTRSTDLIVGEREESSKSNVEFVSEVTRPRLGGGGGVVVGTFNPHTVLLFKHHGKNSWSLLDAAYCTRDMYLC